MNFVKEVTNVAGMMNRISESYSKDGFVATVQGVLTFKNGAINEVLGFTKARTLAYVIALGLIGSGVGFAMNGLYFASALGIFAAIVVVWLDYEYRNATINSLRYLTSTYMSAILHMEQFEKLIDCMVEEKKTTDPELDAEKFRESIMKLRFDVTLDVTKRLMDASGQRMNP